MTAVRHQKSSNILGARNGLLVGHHQFHPIGTNRGSAEKQITGSRIIQLERYRSSLHGGTEIWPKIFCSTDFRKIMRNHVQSEIFISPAESIRTKRKVSNLTIF